MAEFIPQDISFCNGVNRLADNNANLHIGNKNTEHLNQIMYRDKINVKTIKLNLVRINNFNVWVYKNAIGTGFMRDLKLAPLVNDGIIKVKIPLLSKGSDSLRIFNGNIELNLILTNLNSRAL